MWTQKIMGPGTFFFFFLFILIGTFAVLNLIIASFISTFQTALDSSDEELQTSFDLQFITTMYESYRKYIEASTHWLIQGIENEKWRYYCGGDRGPLSLFMIGLVTFNLFTMSLSGYQISEQTEQILSGQIVHYAIM